MITRSDMYTMLVAYHGHNATPKDIHTQTLNEYILIQVNRHKIIIISFKTVLV